MADDDPPMRSGDYRLARIGAAMAFTGLVVVLSVVDVVRIDYDVQPILTTTLLVTILTLLGIEAIDIFRRP